MGVRPCTTPGAGGADFSKKRDSFDLALHNRADVGHLCAAPASVLPPTEPAVQIGPLHHQRGCAIRLSKISLDISSEVAKSTLVRFYPAPRQPQLQVRGEKRHEGLRRKPAN